MDVREIVIVPPVTGEVKVASVPEPVYCPGRRRV